MGDHWQPLREELTRLWSAIARIGDELRRLSERVTNLERRQQDIDD